MPQDTRRLAAPDNSVSLARYRREPVLYVLGGSKRGDGRGAEDPRPLFMKTGPITQARGSAYVEVGATKVICAVYGPRQVQKREDFSMKGQLMCEFKFATFSSRKRRQHQQDSQEKDYGRFIVNSLEPAVLLDKFPKAELDIFVTVLQNDGSALAASVTAASLAVADAGIEMYDLVIGGALRQIGHITLMDPCGDEEEYVCQSNEQVDGLMTLAFMPSLQQVSSMLHDGHLQCDEVTKAISTLMEYCQQVHVVVQDILTKAVQEKLMPER